jgi:preprotein translocase subunit SecF
VGSAKSISQLEYEALVNYDGYNMQRLKDTMRTMKRSLPYMGGCLALMAISTFFVESQARNHVLGADFRGGKELDLKSDLSNSDYYYNREFQRMFYLSENVVPSKEHFQVSDRVFQSMKAEIEPEPIEYISKRAAHEKYFL